jgi:hypothetical protein
VQPGVSKLLQKHSTLLFTGFGEPIDRHHYAPAHSPSLNT